jgi:hypothetical protein
VKEPCSSGGAAVYSYTGQQAQPLLRYIYFLTVMPEIQRASATALSNCLAMSVCACFPP